MTGKPSLVALLDERVVGDITETRGRLTFTYHDSWRSREESYPLSLSMPLTSAEHGHDVVEAYLWGLLPDNERTLSHYTRLFGVSRNPVAILTHIGADCAGAIQLVPPERVPEFEMGGHAASIEWLTEAEIAQELRSVKKTGLPGTDRRTMGRFSLAGAQPKIALANQGDRWGKPLGRTPTTHILKPPSGEFPGFAENEHICLDVAETLGLVAASSTVRVFDGESAIVVKRFDRLPGANGWRRVHQEDICQATSVLPWNKYENEGGPGIPAIVDLLQEHSISPEIDQGRFLDMIGLNWVLAATDAHAKNYALLHLPGGGIRLAPFYDIASYLPYADQRLHEIRMAMRVGHEYEIRNVSLKDWKALAAAAGLSPDYVVDRLMGLLPRIPDAVQMAASRAVRDGLDQQIVQDLTTRIVRHCTDCLKRIRLDLTAA